ncbi:MAG: hypothetical protein HMLKMBBP_03297 [Planctomycetes bacterium]|nr:hypothetical protein [Planctomycetota bacterium]
MKSVKYREAGPTTSRTPREPQRAPPRSHEASHLVPPPEFGVWNEHGGIHFSAELDPVTFMRIPDFAVATVGYAHATPNEFDFNDIQTAILALGQRLRYDDGSLAFKRGSSTETYLPSRISLVVIRQGTYVPSSGISLGLWVHLVADGAVTIRGDVAAPQVIMVSRISGAAPAGGTVPVPKLGGASVVSGVFRLEPSVGNMDQRGIRCNEGARFDVEGATFAGFRSPGSGAAINGFLGRAANCTFDGCVAAGAAASGGAVAGVTDKGVGIVDGRKLRYRYGRASLVQCTFTNCSAGFNGGAIDQVGVVSGCSFTECSAMFGSGGACHDATRVKECRFVRCHAGRDGGALSNVSGWADYYYTTDDLQYDDEFFVESCTFTGCGASRGGAVANADVVISKCFLDRNVATGAGGGGFYGVRRDIERCSVTRNAAVAGVGKKKKPGNHLGGGLLSCSGNITSCIIAANHAGEDGGGLCNCSGALLHLDILQNKADGLGGGARNCRGRIQNCIILGNWSLKSAAKSASNQLSNCSDPRNCFLPHMWSGGGRGNVLDILAAPDPSDPGAPRDLVGPGFRDLLPGQKGDFRSLDPTTLSQFEVLDYNDAARFLLTASSRAIDEAKNVKDVEVSPDFGGLARPNPGTNAGDKDVPDIGAYEFYASR